MFAIFVTATLLFSVVKSMPPAISKQTTCPVGSSLITFDDIKNATGTPGVPVPNGYGGLNWENVLVLNGVNDSNPGTGYRTGVVSPPYLAFDGYGGPMAVKSTATSTFSINSFYSCAVWYDNVTLAMTGTKSGTTLYTKTISLFIQNRTFVELNWSDIDSMYFNSSCDICCGSKHFTMDNLCVTF